MVDSIRFADDTEAAGAAGLFAQARAGTRDRWAVVAPDVSVLNELRVVLAVAGARVRDVAGVSLVAEGVPHGVVEVLRSMGAVLRPAPHTR